VLREGNSDRRAPARGEELRPQAPALDGRLERRLQDARRHHGRRRLLRQRAVVDLAAADTLRIEHVAADGTVTVLKDGLKVLAGEIVDGTVMSVRALDEFLPSRSPAPRPRACCSRCTSRPR
jgi:isocitrate dehydrogenase